SSGIVNYMSAVLDGIINRMNRVFYRHVWRRRRVEIFEDHQLQRRRERWIKKASRTCRVNNTSDVTSMTMAVHNFRGLVNKVPSVKVINKAVVVIVLSVGCFVFTLIV